MSVTEKLGKVKALVHYKVIGITIRDIPSYMKNFVLFWSL